MDYFSKWLKIIKVNNKTSVEIINKFKNIFSTHGIPKILISDNMPFSSFEMAKFAKEWNFQIITSSPRYPRSNGQEFTLQNKFFAKPLKKRLIT